MLHLVDYISAGLEIIKDDQSWCSKVAFYLDKSAACVSRLVDLIFLSAMLANLQLNLF